MVNCKECFKDFETDKEFHSHLKDHSFRQAEYYQKHESRYDLFDGSMIRFKNKEQYLSTDFNSRPNLKGWLKKEPKEKALNYCRNLLAQRKEKKNLTYTPTQVELRSIMSPPVHFLNDLFEGYYEECERMSFKNKYSYPVDQMTYDSAYGRDDKIYIDTREQKPLSFKRETEIKTLKFGDYSFSNKEASCNCYIERKALGDFIGTLSGGYDRFCREIERAQEAKASLIILVEESLENCLKFNLLPQVYKKKTRINPDYIFHNVRNIIQKYPFVQFLFVRDRDEASEMVEKLFTCKCNYKKVDLQLSYDLKLL